MSEDLEFVDTTVYDQNRLLRLPNTRNGKSGLFKIPLHTHEVQTLSVEDIEGLASQGPREIEYPSWDDVGIATPCEEKFQSLDVAPPNPTLGSSLFPKRMRVGDGRDNQAFRIARFFRDHQICESVTHDILELWDGQQVDPLGNRILEEKIGSAYSRTGINFKDKIAVDDIKTPVELAAEYQIYINKLKSNKITLGLPQIDDCVFR